ncbi:hypothetical protein [Silvibacterium acidisoli]|uniref:hypothetical protein n=1 Tax=Acidobacteriaceae bacterium ZG23-2 TaxID=2883246 RepID=UPI00406C09B6
MTVSRFSPGSVAAVALQQIALAAVLLLLVAGWLHVPDANAFEVLASILLALLIALAAGAGESAIALRMVGRPVSARRLLSGTGVVLIAALVWYLISLGIDNLNAKDGLWAGYLNSRFPASLRNLFSYLHLYILLFWMWSALQWISAGLLGAIAFALVACGKLQRGLPAILGSGRYWLSLLLLAIVEAIITGSVLSWTPGHGLTVETFSLLLRLLIVILLNAVSVALLMQSMARAILRLQSAGTGEPDTSHPRTTDIP